MKTKLVRIAVFVSVILFGRDALASEDSLITAVYSNVSNNYKREKQADGSFKPEFYAISNGGYTPGVGHDPSIDNIPFSTIAGVAEQFLAKKEYHMANDSKSAQLLLVVKWGASVPFNDGIYRNRIDQLSTAMNGVQMTKTGVPVQRGSDGIQSAQDSVAQVARDGLENELLSMQMAEQMRSTANEKNAMLLGYMTEINESNNMARFAGGGDHYEELVSDIESSRYYVIISAYDFKSVVQGKDAKLLWSTRVSIQAQGNRFDERLVTMMANASRQFGQSSGRLLRQYQRSPKVNLGELKFLGVVSDPATKESAGKQN